jgi:hypothetical protein
MEYMLSPEPIRVKILSQLEIKRRSTLTDGWVSCWLESRAWRIELTALIEIVRLLSGRAALRRRV